MDVDNAKTLEHGGVIVNDFIYQISLNSFGTGPNVGFGKVVEFIGAKVPRGGFVDGGHGGLKTKR